MTEKKNKFINKYKKVECNNINCRYMKLRNRVSSDFPIRACRFCAELINRDEGESDYLSEENQ